MDLTRPTAWRVSTITTAKPLVLGEDRGIHRGRVTPPTPSCGCPRRRAVMAGVTLDHATKLRWNTADGWIWSTEQVHEALVTKEDFDRTQQLMAAAGRRPVDRKPHRSRHDYVFKGLAWCGHCSRRVQGRYFGAFDKSRNDRWVRHLSSQVEQDDL